MDEMDDMHNVTNLLCNVCGENNFNVLEGYYYCQECGTKQDQMRDIEVDQEDMFNEGGKFAVKHKLKKVERTAHVELTSWEFYNYVLRGMVEDLLNLGAKEELKLMALQVWAAYLRRNEVAFFSKTQSELPKLGVRYYKRDARTIYNHKAEKLKNKRLRSVSSKIGDEQQKRRAWNKSKRKLDESVYSLKSNVTIGTAFTDATLNTTQQSVNTTAALQLKYSTAARKNLKKTMPLKHLAKHECDADGLMTCHDMRPKSRSLDHLYASVNTMSIKQVYAILGIALNLIDDDIQLSDLLRFIAEEHITTRSVLQYLPENVRERGKEMLQEIDFFIYPDKYSDKIMRDHITLLARVIPIMGFNKPDMYALAQRYISDLNLPPDFAQYVERLINILPPEMQKRSPHQYPPYEARAIAYIVFVAKLLFGLDDEKERIISESATEINKQLLILKATTSAGLDGRHQPLLFVWKEWVEYVEMRKLIVSQYNASFCHQFKQPMATDTFVDDMQAKERQQKEDEHNHRVCKSAQRNEIQDNMRRIFEALLTKLMGSGESQQGRKQDAHIVFQPSLMPSHNYFKRLLLHDSTSKNNQSVIPEFMRVDHTQRTLNPYVDASTLRQYLASCHWQLNIEDVHCTSNRDEIGIFRSYRKFPDRLKVFKANTDITKDEWLQEIKKKQNDARPGIIFKKNLKLYGWGYRRKLGMDKKRIYNKDNLSDLEIQQEQERTLPDHSDVFTRPSYEVYSEENMEPLEIELTAPRRNKNSEDLFSGYRDDDDCIPTGQNLPYEKQTDNENSATNSLTLHRSSFDYWTLFGYTTLSATERNELLDKLPLSLVWLLNTCSQMIGIEWFVLYEQLLILEMAFTNGIANLDNFKDCLYYTYNNPVRDINVLTKSFRELW